MNAFANFIEASFKARYEHDQQNADESARANFKKITNENIRRYMKEHHLTKDGFLRAVKSIPKRAAQ